MVEEPPPISSASWTGEQQPPRRRKPPTVFQLRLMFGLSLAAIFYAALTLANGFRLGRIEIPFYGHGVVHHFVTWQSRAAFVACIAGWIVFFAVAALVGLAACVNLRVRRKQS